MQQSYCCAWRKISDGFIDWKSTYGNDNLHGKESNLDKSYKDACLRIYYLNLPISIFSYDDDARHYVFIPTRSYHEDTFHAIVQMH